MAPDGCGEGATPFFAVACEAAPGCWVVHCSGELDLQSSPRLQDALMVPLTAPGGPVVLDLTELQFIDSSGLAVLVVAHKRLRVVGRDLVLRHPTARVRRVLAIAGLDEVLTVEP